MIAAGVLITPVLLSPVPGFRAPLATVVEASDGTLIGARIADDGQWRFPASGIPRCPRRAGCIRRPERSGGASIRQRGFRARH